MKTTYIAKIKDITRNWHIVDAKDKVVGKLATKIADTLRGKNKPIFTSHVDCGDFVIVINAKHAVLTGKKMAQKEYFRHSRYFGHLKRKTAEKVMETKPEDVIYDAVKGMIPRNKLRDPMLKRLKIFAEGEHPHIAQQAKEMTI